LAQGRQTTSRVTRKRLANQLAQLRKDMARQDTLVNMLNAQIDIISTDIHNLTLIQHGQMAELPDAEELTQNAVRAEEMLESLKADADLAASLQTGMEQAVSSDEELAILKEFEGPQYVDTEDEGRLRGARETEQVKEIPPETERPPRRMAEPEP
jgi:hypothetical protein